MRHRIELVPPLRACERVNEPCQRFDCTERLVQHLVSQNRNHRCQHDEQYEYWQRIVGVMKDLTGVPGLHPILVALKHVIKWIIT